MMLLLVPTSVVAAGCGLVRELDPPPPPTDAGPEDAAPRQFDADRPDAWMAHDAGMDAQAPEDASHGDGDVIDAYTPSDAFLPMDVWAPPPRDASEPLDGGDMLVPSPCEPSATRCVSFTRSGLGRFVVPMDVHAIDVKLWGAGGGGTGSDDMLRSGGGHGGYVKVDGLPVTPGETLAIVVGEGGQGGLSMVSACLRVDGMRGVRGATIGGGGAGSNSPDACFGASGGGRSAIIRASEDVVTAGGGGGSGYAGTSVRGGHACVGPRSADGSGVDVGGGNALDRMCADCAAGAGFGAGIAAGGAGGPGCPESEPGRRGRGGDGSQIVLTGLVGVCGFVESMHVVSNASGGGGGGYFGGGAGGWQLARASGGGGGGSCHAATSASIAGSTGDAPPHSDGSDGDYVSPAARGAPGNANTAAGRRGGDGLVVIRW